MLVIGEAADDPQTLCLTEALQPDILLLDVQQPPQRYSRHRRWRAVGTAQGADRDALRVSPVVPP